MHTTGGNVAKLTLADAEEFPIVSRSAGPCVRGLAMPASHSALCNSHTSSSDGSGPTAGVGSKHPEKENNRRMTKENLPNTPLTPFPISE